MTNSQVENEFFDAVSDHTVNNTAPTRPKLMEFPRLVDGNHEGIVKFFEQAKRNSLHSNQIKRLMDEELRNLDKRHFRESSYRNSYQKLTLLCSLPTTTTTSSDPIDLTAANNLLDKRICGATGIKDLLLEMLATSKCTKKTFGHGGKILTFYGDPGTGKTTIGETIAELLGRPLVTIGVSSALEDSDIEGDSPYTDGGKAGLFVEALIQSGSTNPVVLLKHVNRISKYGWRIETSSIRELSKILNPDRNGQCRNEFLKCDVDFSKVLFVATADKKLKIPRSIRPSLEFIRVKKPTLSEKLDFAKKGLIPQIAANMGTERRQIEFTDAALTKLIKKYCTKRGVRDLESHLSKIIDNICLSKSALGAVRSKVIVDVKSLSNYDGKTYCYFDPNQSLSAVVVGLPSGKEDGSKPKSVSRFGKAFARLFSGK